MKRIFACTLVLLLLFVGCVSRDVEESTSAGDAGQSESLPPTQETEPMIETRPTNDFREAVERFFLKHESEICGYWWLPSGCVLVASPDPDRSGESSIVMDWEIYDEVNGEIVCDDYSFLLQISGVKEGAVRIFYDEDWETQAYCPEPFSITYYESCFFWHTGKTTTEAVICVIPNIHYPIIPYEYSEFYCQFPKDSLGTEPIEVAYPNWNYNYPIWIFAIDKKEIDESYELRYMDFVLTGEDLLSSTWRIGDAPAFD